jgi:hypothetical protein
LLSQSSRTTSAAPPALYENKRGLPARACQHAALFAPARENADE